MTASLLSTLLAVLFAGLGYVAGRVHQWHRGAWDREEAYREGYDEATRSTLSMAARLAAPGRSPSADNPAHTEPSTSGPTPSAPLSAQIVPVGRSALPTIRAAASNPDAPGEAPRVGGGDGSSIDAPGPVKSPALSLPSMPGRDFSAPEASGPGASGPAIPFAPADAASGPALIPGARSGTGGEPGAFFEPVVQEPSAVDEVPVPRLGRRGRHYVPDELVRAATYRLSPDRVARAKVPGALPPDDDTPEPPHNHVPRPRSS